MADSADVSFARHRVQSTYGYSLEKKTYVLERLASAFSKAVAEGRSERAQAYVEDGATGSEVEDDEDADLEATRVARQQGSIVERKPVHGAALRKFSDSKVSMSMMTLQNERAPAAFPAYLLEKHEELSYH